MKSKNQKYQNIYKFYLVKVPAFGTLQPVGCIFPTNDQYAITQQKGGFVVCNLKPPESRHQRKPLKSGARESQKK